MATASTSSGTEHTSNEELFKQFYETRSIIDKGSYGTVFEGKRLADGTPVVVKRIQTKDIKQWEEVDDVLTPLEIVIHRKLAHIPGIVQLIESFDCGEHHMIVMEKLDNPINLEDHVVQGTLLTEANSPKYFEQIIRILLQCYEAGIVHRDIKPGNILLDQSTDKIYLIDFGSATYIKNEPFREIVGAILYYPPESFLKNQYYGGSSTVWALGTLFYELLTGDVPFLSQRDICKKPLFFNKNFSDICKNFLRGCLKKQAEARPPLESLLSDPFVSNK